ncbi:MAG: hypothetical protein V1722_04395 [Candidatus Micrarchaeota archaeon]
MGLFSFGKKPIEQLLKEGVKNEAELKQLISEACSKGAVHAKFFLDAHSVEKTAAEDSLITLVAQLTKEKGVLYCKGIIEPTVESDGLNSAFTTVDLVTTNFRIMVSIAMRYGPTSVEIMEPNDKVVVPVADCQGILLNASDMSQSFSRHIMENSMNEQQRVTFTKQMQAKADYGAKLREKAEKTASKP